MTTSMIEPLLQSYAVLYVDHHVDGLGSTIPTKVRVSLSTHLQNILMSSASSIAPVDTEFILRTLSADMMLTSNVDF